MLLKFVLLVLVLKGTHSRFCEVSNEDIEKIGRIVFGEARGESSQGQIAVAYTIVNRIRSNLYPNTLDGVISVTYTFGGKRYHEYNTLDVQSHTLEWENAKKKYTPVYRRAIIVARDALCGNRSDPTTCAVAYCATSIKDCSATKDNEYSRVTKTITIGRHVFVCRVKTR
ncbi:spore cortex-lytic enzyme-like [Saccostrea cucullata]|uniref:spore cortex-lytic enzyme-like n=1 Tax=Saccostrea cuccullata TaxID=36930 RepID=UPI002ED35B0F